MLLDFAAFVCGFTLQRGTCHVFCCIDQVKASRLCHLANALAWEGARIFATTQRFKE